MVTIVLLPGLDGTGQLLVEAAAKFGSFAETKVISYPTDIPLGYAELESFVREALPTNQPYFLLAESFSGPIAISIAASSPTGLLGLILCCSFARNPLPMLSIFRSVVGVIPVSSVPISLLSIFVLGRSSSMLYRSALANSLSRVAPVVLRTRVRAVLSVDVSALLPRISVPILYLRASEDKLVRRSSLELIESLTHSLEVCEFSAPHFLLQVAPSQVVTKVLEFMDLRSVTLESDANRPFHADVPADAVPPVN